MRKPNIVTIVSHDTGRYISPYGVETVDTPAYAKVAAEGAVFDQAFCCAPQCSPARAALFTGKFPHSVGVLGLTGGWAGWELKPGTNHLAGMLTKHGYHSACIGIAHEAILNRRDQIERCGFEDLRYFNDRNAENYESYVGMLLNEWEPDECPFYIQIGTQLTHKGYRGNRKGKEEGTVPEWLDDGPATREDFADLQGAVGKLDRIVGRIMSVLEERGVLDETIILVTTDHGLAVPRAKCTLYDPGIGVFLMMRWPEKIPAQRITQQVSHVDVVPTLLELAGLSVPEGLHGRSLLPLLEGFKEGQSDLPVFAEKTYHTQYDPMRCIRKDRYKYIRNFEPVFHERTCNDCQEEPMYFEQLPMLKRHMTLPLNTFEELYDLKEDPLEHTNLAGNREFENVRMELERELALWMHETQDPLLNGPVEAPTARMNREFLLEIIARDT